MKEGGLRNNELEWKKGLTEGSEIPYYVSEYNANVNKNHS